MAMPWRIKCALSVWMVLLQFPLPMLHSHEMVGVADPSLLSHIQRHHARPFEFPSTRDAQPGGHEAARHLHFVMPWEYGEDAESDDDSRRPEAAQPRCLYEGRDGSVGIVCSTCLALPWGDLAAGASYVVAGQVVDDLILSRLAHYADFLFPPPNSLINRLGIRRC
jgi:hypothetical protein